MKAIYVVFLLIIAGLIFWLCLVKSELNNLKGQPQHSDTIRVTKFDTIKITKPVFIKETLIDTLFVPILDTIRINDTLYQQLPKTQRKYQKDSIYVAWVSGYKPQLDSINVFQKKETITITKTYKPRIGFGVMAGYGLNTSFQLRPTISVGVYYKIF